MPQLNDAACSIEIQCDATKQPLILQQQKDLPLTQIGEGMAGHQEQVTPTEGPPTTGVDLNQESTALHGGGDLLKKIQEACSTLSCLTHDFLSSYLSTTNCPYRAGKLVEMREHISAIMLCAQSAGSDSEQCPGAKVTKRSSSSPGAEGSWDGDLTDQENTTPNYATKTSEMEFIPGSIGRRCEAYKRPIATIEDHGADQLSGKRRKLCGNPLCATHRHRKPMRTDALKVCDWIEHKATDDILSKLWLYIDGSPEIKLTGQEIRQRLLWQTPLDLEMASVVIRLPRELEEETLFRRPNCQGRHYVDPAWGVMVANGSICPEASFDHFMYPAPPYDIKSCSIVLTLVCVNSNWSCYAFDFGSNVIAIMDPMVRHPVEESKVIEHTSISKKLLAEVIYCMRRATGNAHIGHGKWTPRMMMAGGRKPAGVNTGIIALNCMRWYNANSVCDPPCDGQAAQTRKDLTFQLLTMRSNQAKPAISDLVNNAVRSANKGKKKQEEETSLVDSCGGDNEEITHSSAGPAHASGME
ncbi:hypothetical protein EJB05_34242, partial [Eragrostis curvula]